MSCGDENETASGSVRVELTGEVRDVEISTASGTAEAVHDGARFAMNTGFYFFSVNGASAFFQRIARLKDSDPEIRAKLHQLIR